LDRVVDGERPLQPLHHDTANRSGTGIVAHHARIRTRALANRGFYGTEGAIR